MVSERNLRTAPPIQTLPNRTIPWCTQTVPGMYHSARVPASILLSTSGHRNIKNKPIVNRDPREAQMALLHEQITRLKAERDAALRQAGLEEGDLARLLPVAPENTGKVGGREEHEEAQRLAQENRRLQERLDQLESELAAAREQAAEASNIPTSSRFSFCVISTRKIFGKANPFSVFTVKLNPNLKIVCKIQPWWLSGIMNSKFK